jgi:hypothetical protein
MPPRETSGQRRRRLSIASGITNLSSDFTAMCKKKPHRIGIVAEGDSWFSYPRKWILFGADMNVLHHLSDKFERTNTVNLLKLSSNGDEAVNMTSGDQFKKLYKILKKNQPHIKILLFSGGGNDIVGKNDMLPLLNEYTQGMSALDCINIERFEHKLTAIELSYRRLIDLCKDVIPNAKIVTHTYDIVKPQDDGAEFFWGLIKTKPWIYPYLVRRSIPADLHLPIVEHLLGTFGQRLIALAKEPSVRNHIVVVNTQGTLRPGHKTDWENEIHPTRSGFKRITRKIYPILRQLEPNLPA